MLCFPHYQHGFPQFLGEISEAMENFYGKLPFGESAEFPKNRHKFSAKNIASGEKFHSFFTIFPYFCPRWGAIPWFMDSGEKNFPRREKSNKNLEEFPYRFDELEAQRAIDWIEEFKHSKGELAGTRIKAHIFIKFILANVYGWINIKTGYRRFKRMYEQVGRKNAKSQTLAGITTYELAPYGVLGSEVYCLAPVSKQAKAVFKEAINMINGHRIIKRKFHIRESTNEIFHKKSNSTMSLFTKDDLKKGDSYNPQLAVIDEYHLFDTSEAVDVMESGMGARYNPLIAIITTAGRKIFLPLRATRHP